MAVTLEDLLDTAWGGVLTQEQLAYVLWLLNSPPPSMPPTRIWVDEVAIAIHQATFVDGEPTTELDANPALWIGSDGPPADSSHFINWGPEGFVVLPNLGEVGRVPLGARPGQTIRARLHSAVYGRPVMELRNTRWNAENPTVGSVVELANYHWCRANLQSEVMTLQLPEATSILVFADRPLPDLIKSHVAKLAALASDVIDEATYDKVTRQLRHDTMLLSNVDLFIALQPALEAENADDPAALDAIDTIRRNPTPSTASILATVDAAEAYEQRVRRDSLSSFEDFDHVFDYTRLAEIAQRQAWVLAPLQHVVDLMVSPRDYRTLPLPGI